MARFCYICGKPENNEGLCDSCFSEKTTLVTLPRTVLIKSCSKCKMACIKNKWVPLDIRKHLESITGEKIIEFNLIYEGKSNSKYDVVFEGSPGDMKSKKQEVHMVSVHFNRVMCPVCTRINCKYYEAIIQLRVSDERVLKFILKRFEDNLTKNRMAFYYIEENDDGVDIFSGDKILAEKLAYEAKNRYGLKAKKSYKLRGIKDGKTVYRSVYLLRSREFEFKQ